MNNKISNPLLKNLISEIANKANQGRIKDLSWGAIYEAKKKKVANEATEKKLDEPTEDIPSDGDTGDTTSGDKTSKKSLPPLGKSPQGVEKKSDTIAEPSDAPEGNVDQEDVEKAKQDATKAKAELEKSKAETSAAEKELKKHGYIRLASQGGITFLLKKLVTPAAMSNTLDALVPEMMEGLHIKTKKDVDAFKADSALHMTVEGMSDLIEKMESLAEKAPETTEKAPE